LSSRVVAMKQFIILILYVQLILGVNTLIFDVNTKDFFTK
jgi:hypothetical protein